MTHALTIPQTVFSVTSWKLAATMLACFCLALVIQAQTTPVSDTLPPKIGQVIEGSRETDVMAFGESVEVRGTVKAGVVALGGDVYIKGRIEGDVGTVGGNVILEPGAFVGGDIMVLGGAYQSDTQRPDGRMTLVFAGYEQELRELMLNPVSFLQPHFTPAYFGQRVLAILFWFITSLLLAAISPGAVSRAVERLRITSPRVALIGLLGAVVMTFGVALCLRFLPGALGALLGAMLLVLLLVAYVFGRVVLHATTGRWLQRLIWPNGARSESIALLLGVGFWTIVLSLPFLWPLVVTSLLITSLGLALTARYRINWKHS